MTDATASPPEENLPEPGPVAATSDDVGLAILKACHGVLKETKKAWADLSENQQEHTLRRLEVAIKDEVRRGFAVILADEFPNAEATLDKVGFTPKGVQGTISLAAHSEHRHVFADHTGGTVLVVMASPERFLQRMGELRGEKDQRPLFQDGEVLEFGGDRHPAADPETPTSDDEAPPVADGEDEATPDLSTDVYPGEHARETVLALLEIAGLTGYELADVAAWDQETRALVIDWAGATALKGSHPDIHVPPLPAVLATDDEEDPAP